VSKRARPAVGALALACAAVAAGCGSAAHSASGVAPEAAPGGAAFLATSRVTGAGTWAVAVMGGSVASHNNFWQLFVRPAGSATWKLATPPGVPSNGGLVLADAGGSLISAFRPSQYLTYTPLAVTRNGGLAWSPAGPLDGALADVPDALAAAPRTGHLLALLSSGAAELAAPGYTRWSAVASRRALAATPAGRRCGLRGLTAAAFSPAGVPLLAGTCGHPGMPGVFALRNGTWQAAGPALPGAFRRDVVTVLRLTLAGSRTAALLTARNGRSASLFAAWSADGGARWAVSAPFPLGPARVFSSSVVPAGTIVLNGTAPTFIPVAGSWRSLPAVPAGTATVAPGPAGGFDALAVHGTRLTVWQFDAVTVTWRATQALHVPIQFGSSG
jgi:hypothetical protein